MIECLKEGANVSIPIIFLVFILFFFTAVAVSFLLMVQNKWKSKVLEDMAYVDPVTGGNTYHKFLIAASAVLSKKGANDYVTVKIGIDNFKYINSLFGYEYGDNIIRGMYLLLEKSLQEGELLCHGYADHFIALFLYDGEQKLESRIQKAVAPMSAQLGVILQLSCGACLLSQVDHTNTIQAAVENAETAARMNKKNSLRTVNMFTEQMGISTKAEEEIKQCMKKALINYEFEPYYQPKYDIQSSKINGAEVLVRWRHPKKGLISPDQFIPVIEKTGFIIEVDLYMFECACRKIREYMNTGIEPIPISVNFSRMHFFYCNFIEKLTAICKEYGIPPRLIEIEITETAVFDNLERFKILISGLKDLGFVLSMDDFGSGYSSLNMLKDLSIDILKIDKEFFGETGENNRREIVLESIVDMAKKLNVKVIAEGVETLEQVNMLKRIHCTTVQGYFYSKPVSSCDFDRLYLGDKVY